MRSSSRSIAAAPSSPGGTASVPTLVLKSTRGERSGSASDSSAIARAVASIASSRETSDSRATASQASEAAMGRASISHTSAMFVCRARFEAAAFSRARKPASARSSRHCRASPTATSNDWRAPKSAGASMSRTRGRSAAGTPDEPTIAASIRRSSTLPRFPSCSHSTIPCAKPTWPAWAAA